MSLAARAAEAAGLARARLLETVLPAGNWAGRLSDSALSTATALSALAVVGDPRDEVLRRAAVAWLAGTQLADGSFGDTPQSPGNLSTTLLAAAALRLAGEGQSPCAARTQSALAAYGATDPAATVAAIRGIYGADRTFAVPILMNCALAGLVPWEDVPGLPFELAALPRGLYRALRMQVVSYALPALIAIGLLVRQRGRASALARLAGGLTRARVLRLLAAIQPPGGGFLEAVPLTAFVAMGLGSAAVDAGPVVARCLEFLRRTARPSGAWPIDADLTVWVTTNALAALDADGNAAPEVLARSRAWVAARRLRKPHPYTGAAPGAWAWTDLPGGVPDADDTSGAVLALAGRGQAEAVSQGVRWLLDMQNHDGGWPTFCRGWGQLPFDRSCADITAHALRALRAAQAAGDARVPDGAVRRGFRYLLRSQREDGSWLPLWFGNQHAPERLNPVLGTSRVLRALSLLDPGHGAARRGIAYLRAAQHPHGGWGGAPRVAATVEETALALLALADWPEEAAEALRHGAQYLADRVAAEGLDDPAPIGLYFSQLWYSEALYPVAWSLEALARVRTVL
jgi:squalene-hopene/tetraprenyl-beta-curcumene cyclase